ncbi:hypothetical protein CVT26_013023 [Gymnopilus dilepis]|uniref:Peptidase C14 caspase domain-containing protein n=1 Tax=Gymnopilus dilepis TaxID=231916 RepID=A0A409Y488_9AGAR|nr:hypothetical protein CVT26_013023 [Gymnopilus dilepis]
MFALVIGIDNYASDNIQSLHGSVADARAFKAYLTDTLLTPEDHIMILENAFATRIAIMDGLRRLAADPRIGTGDPVIIFYAGHGSRARVVTNKQSTEATTNVPVILPSDVLGPSRGDNIVQPIPYYVIDALLGDIAQRKGNNVVLVLDSCFSSASKGTHPKSSFVRAVDLPPNFCFHADTEHEHLLQSPFFSLSSYVLLSACSSSGQAWERDGRGVFTFALLDLLCTMSIVELRYSDAIMLLDIDSTFTQSPYCLGRNQGKLLFSLTPPPYEHRFLVPIRTRLMKDSPVEYVLSGGEAHGLAAGDEFEVYPDLDYPHRDGTLAITKLGSFYSVLQPLEKIVPISRNSIAKKAQHGRRELLHIYSRPEDDVRKILLLLEDEDKSMSNIVAVNNANDAHLIISMQQDNVVIVELTTIMAVQLSFQIEVRVEDLAPILLASSNFFSSMKLVSEDDSLTEDVQIELYRLPLDFPAPKPLTLNVGRPLQDRVVLDRGSHYDLRITNQSQHDLYPIVEVFHLNHELQHDILYHPGYGHSVLDCPLQRGHSLSVNFDTFCPPIEEHMAFLKFTFSTRPLDPLYDSQTLRSARRLPEKFEGRWATISKLLISRSPERKTLGEQEYQEK